MHIVAFGWLFVVVLMAAAEATSPQGTLLGAFITLVLYGLLPLSIVLYVMGTPMRRRAHRAAEAAASAAQRDGSSQPSGAPVTPEREEP
jgi:membrane protein implicated in regulation of membrane protease activity